MTTLDLRGSNGTLRLAPNGGSATIRPFVGVGATGPTSTVPGPIGAKGDKGDKGDTGPQGIPGANAIPTDNAVANLVTNPSATQTAADARFAAKSDAAPAGGTVDQVPARVGSSVAWVQEPALVADPARYTGIDLTGATASTGLQTLLDALPSNSYKKSVRLLPGIYFNPTGFTLDRPNVLLEGAGPASLGISGGATSYGSTELRANAAGAAILTVGNTASTDWRGVQVRNIGLSDSSATKDQVLYGIKLLRQNGGTLENIAVHDITAGSAVYSIPTAGNPQYWTIRNPQFYNVLFGINQSASSSDWQIFGGYMWGVSTSAGGVRAGSVGMIDQGTMKVFGLSIQYFETELQILGTNSQYTGLTIETSTGLTTPKARVGVEFGATASGNRVFLESANASTYTTQRAASLLTGSSGNEVRAMYSGNPSSARVIDDNAGATGNRISERGLGDSMLQLSDQGALPTASATYRGVTRATYGGTGVADTVKTCVKQADGSYAWVSSTSTSGGTSTGSASDWTRPTGIVAQNLPRAFPFGNTIAGPTSGQLVLSAIPLNAGDVVTSLTFTSGTTALAGATNQWFSLYDANRNKLAVTADDTTTAWAASTRKTLALSSAYTVPTTGLYYVGVTVVATTMPTFTGMNSNIGTVSGQAPILCGSADTGLTTPATAPATAAALTSVPRLLYVQAS